MTTPDRTAFVHGYWGDPSLPRSQRIRRYILNSAVVRPFLPPRRLYVFGAANYEIARELGWQEVILLDDRPVVWPGDDHWRHKLEVFKVALQDFDAIIWLDLDQYPQQELPADFWDRLRQGAAFQSALRIRHKKSAPWRKADHRKNPNGSWVYLRDPTIPAQIIAAWDSLCKVYDHWLLRTDECAFALWTDWQTRGWQGLDGYYRAGFEPFCSKLVRQAFPEDHPASTGKTVLFYDM